MRKETFLMSAAAMALAPAMAHAQSSQTQGAGPGQTTAPSGESQTAVPTPPAPPQQPPQADQTGAPEAQTVSQPEGQLPEIVVTAERRATSVQKTPLNISVITGEALTKRGITDNRQLLDSIPGLKMNTTNPNAYVGLYGLASGGGTQYADPVMAFNYGGVPLSRQTAAGSAFYDLERVEVLKGPQGTLYGRNATVGVINLIPARPTKDFAGGATVTFGNYATINTTGFLNIPLSDTLSSRVAFQTTRHDGYFTNGLDDANNFGGRASVLWKPTDKLSILVWSDVFFNRARGPYSTFQFYLSANQRWINNNPWFGLGAAGTCSNQLLCPSFATASAGGVNAFPAPGGFGDTTSPYSIGRYSLAGNDGYNNNDQIIASTEINYDMTFATLTIIPSYVHTRIDFLSYSNGLRFLNKTKADQTSLEARLASNGGGPLKWVLGAFYSNERQNALQINTENNGSSLFYTPHLKDLSYAAFGDASLTVVQGFRIDGGLRVMHERKSQDGYTVQDGVAPATAAILTSSGATCISGGTPAAPALYQANYPGLDRSVYPMTATYCTFPNGGKFSDTALSWKIGAEVDLARDVMLYATARTGYRAGGLTVGTNNTYQPEKPRTYELGLRSRFFDRRLQLNVTGFYWDYKNQQLSQLRQYTVNGTIVGQTSYPANYNGYFYGFEADSQILFTPHDRLSVDVLYSKGKYDSTPPVAASTGNVAPQINLPRINLPLWTVSAAYSHVFAMANGASVVPEVRMHYESSARLRIIDPLLLTPGDIRDPYAKLDASLSYNAPDDKWSITAFIDNITNKAVVGVGSSGQTSLPVFFRPITDPTGVRSATLDPPRTYGVRLSARFR